MAVDLPASTECSRSTPARMGLPYAYTKVMRHAGLSFFWPRCLEELILNRELFTRKCIAARVRARAYLLTAPYAPLRGSVGRGRVRLLER
jgi:hypothetical protein